MSKTKLRLGSSALCILVTSMAAAPGNAQTAASEAEGEAPMRTAEESHPDEIVVTARRTAERLQDVPGAVTALSGAALEEKGVTDVASIESYIPNATFYPRGGSANSAAVFIRGVGQTDDLFMFDSGVGIYLDDVYVGRVQGSLFELIDIERVEVLRGPQGSLYGKNTSGGALKIVSKRPDLLEVSGNAAVTLGNYDYLSGKATLNLPIVTDKLGVRANVLRVSRDGFVDNVFDGRDLQTRDFLGFQGSLLARPSGNLRLSISADYGKDDSIPAAPTPIIDFEYPPIGSFPALPPRKSSSSQPLYYKTQNWGLNGTAEMDIGDVRLKSITAFRELEFDNAIDYIGSPINLISAKQTQVSDQFSQELQANMSIGEVAEIVTGLFYMRERSETAYIIPNTIVVPVAPDFALGLPNTSLYDASLQTNSYAVFAHGVFNLTDRLSVSAGIRYSHDEKSYDAELANDVFPTANFAYDLEGGWSKWLPKAGIEYKLTPDHLLYASYATGFKSGGFNPRATSAFFAQRYDPESNDTFELGLKSSLADGKLVLNAAAFYNVFDDFQANIRVLDPGTGLFSGLFANTSGYKSHGLELELLAQPTRGLSVNAHVAYFSDDFASFETGLFGNLKDKELPSAPKWNGTVSADYEFAVGDLGTLQFGGDVAYRSSTFTSLANDPRFVREAHAIVNGRITYRHRAGGWSMFVQGRNLTNKTVLLDGTADLIASYGTAAKYYNDPRTITAGVRFDF